MTPSRRYTPALLLLFVGSGCAALIYENVWLQLLQLVIGSSAVSIGVLLGTFMGGMCLGSLLLPRRVSPQHHPLRIYAYLELGIAAIGILLLYGMPLISGLYTAWAGSGGASIFVRAVAAAICLLPPTMLMGATLPAMSRWVQTTPEGVSWMPDIGAYFSFVVNMFLAFGVTFEVPIAVILCVKVGIVSVAKLREIRPYVIVGAFVVAAIVTPPDMLSQLMLAVPLCLLYEAGILVAWLMMRGSAQQPESEYQ